MVQDLFWRLNRLEQQAHFRPQEDSSSSHVFSSPNNVAPALTPALSTPRLPSSSFNVLSLASHYKGHVVAQQQQQLASQATLPPSSSSSSSSSLRTRAEMKRQRGEKDDVMEGKKQHQQEQKEEEGDSEGFEEEEGNVMKDDDDDDELHFDDVKLVSAGGGMVKSRLRDRIFNRQGVAVKNVDELMEEPLFQGADKKDRTKKEEKEGEGEGAHDKKGFDSSKPDRNFRGMNLKGKTNVKRLKKKVKSVDGHDAGDDGGDGGDDDDDVGGVEMGEMSVGLLIKEKQVWENALQETSATSTWTSESHGMDMEEAMRMSGHSAWREGQKEVCDAIMMRKSTLALLPTGGGKSLCFIVPTIAFPKTLTIVVCPLLSLMRDLMSRLPSCLQGAMLSSSQTPAEQHRHIAKVLKGEARVLFLSPERLMRPTFRELLKRLPPVRLVCVDEAHCVSQWSHNFRTSYLLLKDFLINIVHPQCVLALTATATPRVVNEIRQHLGTETVIRVPLLRPNLFFKVMHELPDPYAVLTSMLKSEPIASAWGTGPDQGRVIVYVALRRQAELISAHLRSQDILAEPYHGAMQPSERGRIERQFRDGKISVVVATVAFGMGIDISHVRVIFHFDMPDSVESYVQAVGRAGRDGRPAHCVVFCSKERLRRLTALAYSNDVGPREVRDLLNQYIFAVKEGSLGCIRNSLLERDKSGALDMPREVGSTLLAWMHRDNWLEVLPEACARFLIQRMDSADTCPMLSFITAHGKQAKGRDMQGWIGIDVLECSEALQMSCDDVHAELERLRKAKVIRYKADEPAQFFKLLHCGTLQQQSELCQGLYKRLVDMQSGHVNRIYHLYNMLAVITPDGGERLKQLLTQYFESGECGPDVPNAAVGCFQDASKDRFLRGDIATCIKNTTGVQTGKQVARIFLGVQSRQDDMHVSNQFWGKAPAIEYHSLVKVATEVILQVKQKQ